MTRWFLLIWFLWVPGAPAAPVRILEGEGSLLEPGLQELAELLPPVEAAGAVVGVIGDAGETLAAVGNPAFTAETLFEFGSVSKVFTAILLAWLAEEGDLGLQDPVNTHLPAAARNPQWDVVTLEHLATHTAGIPRLPPNFKPATKLLPGKANDPYATFGERKLWEGIQRTEAVDPGTRWEYSNFGYAVLGIVLFERTGRSYADLARERLFEPLGMKSATVAGWGAGDIAPPLTRKGKAGAHWNLNSFTSAGGARGSVRDGLAFVRASLHACREDTLEARANCRTQRPVKARTEDGNPVGFGWILSVGPRGPILWHNGGTGGYHTFLGFDARAKTGVVILSNVADLGEIDGWGIDWLTGS